ncbi:MAG: sodium-dependent bicarbonate transport family permease [Sulfuritalea sp.]|nr:sodium-dependent bicarbonate transport family permease [Sulfuritalea sp.]
MLRGAGRQTHWRVLAHEAFLINGVTLLLGGIAIGWAAGLEGLAPVKGLFYDMFKGALVLFLLEMGLIVSRQVGELKNAGCSLSLSVRPCRCYRHCWGSASAC